MGTEGDTWAREPVMGCRDGAVMGCRDGAMVADSLVGHAEKERGENEGEI